MTSPVVCQGFDIAGLQRWEGCTETRYDKITEVPLAALSAILDRDDPAPKPGTALPPLWHWLFFLPVARHCEIGQDGHPQRGGFLPPVPLPRRMWAGGRLRWYAPLRAGDEVHRISRVASVTHKVGRQGDLVFVVIEHVIYGPTGLALTEEQDLVYRAAARPEEMTIAPTCAPASAAFSREVFADPVLLFRYSGLTFNSHRIHYDRPYAMQEEGYPGLVVHGPLIAMLLLDLLRRQHPDRTIAHFSFRVARPTFDQHVLRVSGDPALDKTAGNFRLWAQDHQGALTLQAEAQLAAG